MLFQGDQWPIIRLINKETLDTTFKNIIYDDTLSVYKYCNISLQHSSCNITLDNNNHIRYWGSLCTLTVPLVFLMPQEFEGRMCNLKMSETSKDFSTSEYQELYYSRREESKRIPLTCYFWGYKNK